MNNDHLPWHEVAGPADAPTTVVLLHSSVGDSRMWQPQWPALTARHRVVRLDLRGFGASPLGDEVYRNADDVRAVLDAAGVQRAVIVGASMGGRVALELATVAADRIAGLVLLCPAYRGVPTGEDAAAFGAAEDALLEAGDLDGAVELNVRTWLGPEADDDARDLVRVMQRRAFEVQLVPGAGDGCQSDDVDLSAIAAPTLVVSGAHDLEHFQNVARMVADGIPGAELRVLPWAGHLPSLERPAEITELLLAAV